MANIWIQKIYVLPFLAILCLSQSQLWAAPVSPDGKTVTTPVPVDVDAILSRVMANFLKLLNSQKTTPASVLTTTEHHVPQGALLVQETYRPTHIDTPLTATATVQSTATSVRTTGTSTNSKVNSNGMTSSVFGPKNSSLSTARSLVEFVTTSNKENATTVEPIAQLDKNLTGWPGQAMLSSAENTSNTVASNDSSGSNTTGKRTEKHLPISSEAGALSLSSNNHSLSPATANSTARLLSFNDTEFPNVYANNTSMVNKSIITVNASTPRTSTILGLKETRNSHILLPWNTTDEFVVRSSQFDTNINITLSTTTSSDNSIVGGVTAVGSQLNPTGVDALSTESTTKCACPNSSNNAWSSVSPRCVIGIVLLCHAVIITY